MQKGPLFGVSIIAVVLLVLGSLTNVVGYQTVQSSNQKVINNEVDQKELLFQTILDIANNKEIQKLLLNSQMRGGTGRFFAPCMKFSIFTPPFILTKKYLNNAYSIGLVLSKTFSASKIHSILERYQNSNQEMQKEITAFIEKDAILNGEITQLSNLKCDCKNENTTRWNFPVLCLLLIPFIILALLFYFHGGFGFLGEIIVAIASVLNCSWLH